MPAWAPKPLASIAMSAPRRPHRMSCAPAVRASMVLSGRPPTDQAGPSALAAQCRSSRPVAALAMMRCSLKHADEVQDAEQGRHVAGERAVDKVVQQLARERRNKRRWGATRCDLAHERAAATRSSVSWSMTQARWVVAKVVTPWRRYDRLKCGGSSVQPNCFRNSMKASGEATAARVAGACRRIPQGTLDEVR